MHVSNILKTGLLLGVLTAILLLAGQAIAGEQGMIIAFVLAAIMNVVSYWFSDKLVLMMYGAQPVDEAQAPGLHAMVRRLATRAQILGAMGRWAAAAEDLEAALPGLADRAGGHQALAEAYEHLGRTDDAEAQRRAAGR